MDIKSTAGIVLIASLISSTFTYQYTQQRANTPERKDTKIEVSRNSSGAHELSKIEDGCFSDEKHQAARPGQKNNESNPKPNYSTPSENRLNTPQPDKEVNYETTKNLRQRIKQQESHISTFREIFSNSSGKQAKDLVQSNYESEHTDYGWANQQEGKLLSMFDNDESLQSMAPLDLSCKSENCQIILPAADSTQVGSMYQSVLEAVSRTDDATEKNVSYFTDDEKGQLIIYVSDQGNMSLFE